VQGLKSRRVDISAHPSLVSVLVQKLVSNRLAKWTFDRSEEVGFTFIIGGHEAISGI
jgi:hypothetical protein